MNDSVFHLYEGVEQLIYDFNMSVGDSIWWYDQGGCPIKFRLDSLYKKEIDGSLIDIQEGLVDSEDFFHPRFVRIYRGVGVVESKSNHWDTTLVQDGGSLGFLLPSEGLFCGLDYTPPSLCSFENDIIYIGREYESCRWISSTTQHWFYQNGEWVYNFGGMFDPETYARILKHNYQQDTIIEGETYQLVSNTVASRSGASELSYYDEEPYIMRSEDRKLYYWTGDTTHLVYDFNMSPGDSIEWYPDHEGSDTIGSCRAFFVLDSLSIDSIYQNEYHVQHGRLISKFWEEETKIEIYESIGWVKSYDDYNGYWHSSGFLIPELNLACYWDAAGQGDFCQYTSNFGNRYPMEETDCYDLVSSSERPKIDLEIKIAPNPVNESFQLIGDLSSFESYVIYDINGRKVAGFLSVRGPINVADLPSGLYFLQLQGGHSFLKTIKFSKIK